MLLGTFQLSLSLVNLRREFIQGILIMLNSWIGSSAYAKLSLNSARNFSDSTMYAS